MASSFLYLFKESCHYSFALVRRQAHSFSYNCRLLSFVFLPSPPQMEVALPSLHLNVPPPHRSTPVNRHRHRRSAAISGDFDAPGSLWGPNLLATSPAHSKPVPLAHALFLSLGAAMDVSPEPELDRTFRFNNAEDFSVLPAQFAFPNVPSYDMCKTPPASPRAFNQSVWPNSPFAYSSPVSAMSPSHKRVFGGSRLESPIRLGHSPSRSMPNARVFQMDDATSLRNVPDAIIDLDEALAPQRMGSPRNAMRRYSAEACEAHIPLRCSTPPQPFLDAIFDTAAIQEEDDCEVPEITAGSSIVLPVPASKIPDLQLAPPPEAPLYCNSSASSSLVSLGHSAAGGGSGAAWGALAYGVAKKEFDFETPAIRPPLPRKQRLGAKASRYLAFYDQSSRVSNALKVLSLESINNFQIALPLKDTERRLGHLSSLPSLKQVPVRHTLMSTRSINLGRNDQRPVPNPSSLAQEVSAHSKSSMRQVKPSTTVSSNPKVSSASPISIHLDGLSSTGTVELTDRLSITSHTDAHDGKHHATNRAVNGCPLINVTNGTCTTPPPKPSHHWTVDAHTPQNTATPERPRELSASHRAALSSARIPSAATDTKNPFARPNFRAPRPSGDPGTHSRRHLLIMLLKLDKPSRKREETTYGDIDSDQALIILQARTEVSTSSTSSRASRIRRFFKGR